MLSCASADSGGSGCAGRGCGRGTSAGRALRCPLHRFDAGAQLRNRGVRDRSHAAGSEPRAVVLGGFELRLERVELVGKLDRGTTRTTRDEPEELEHGLLDVDLGDCLERARDPIKALRRLQLCLELGFGKDRNEAVPCARSQALGTVLEIVKRLGLVVREDDALAQSLFKGGKSTGLIDLAEQAPEVDAASERCLAQRIALRLRQSVPGFRQTVDELRQIARAGELLGKFRADPLRLLEQRAGAAAGLLHLGRKLAETGRDLFGFEADVGAGDLERLDLRDRQPDLLAKVADTPGLVRELIGAFGKLEQAGDRDPDGGTGGQAGRAQRRQKRADRAERFRRCRRPRAQVPHDLRDGAHGLRYRLSGGIDLPQRRVAVAAKLLQRLADRLLVLHREADGDIADIDAHGSVRLLFHRFRVRPPSRDEEPFRDQQETSGKIDVEPARHRLQSFPHIEPDDVAAHAGALPHAPSTDRIEDRAAFRRAGRKFDFGAALALDAQAAGAGLVAGTALGAVCGAPAPPLGEAGNPFPSACST